MANTGNLGTAWIQIKPTTTGITSSVKKELQSVEQEFSGGKFQSIFNGLGGNIESTFSSAFKKVGNVSKTLLTAGIGGAIGLIGSSVSSAVDRIDTLNNAPRVFEAMGYAANDVAASMDSLNNYLDGLPTTLDSAINNVQLLAASFGGIKNGTKYFQALNDAGLAFGASQEMIENGIRQISQLDLKGPLDAQTWKSLQNSGFNPVFSALAQQSGISVGELKKQFSSGEKTVQDFLDSLVELDKNGTGSMDSLAEMARKNTDGIKTSFTNAKTAITRGVAESIKTIPEFTSSVVTAGQSIEKVLKGQMGVDEAVENINKFFSNIATGVMDVLTKVLPLVLKTLPTLVRTIADKLVEFLSDAGNRTALIQGFVELFVAVAKAGSEIAMALVPMIPEIIGTIVSEVTKPENIGSLAGGMGILLAGAFAKTIASNVWKGAASKLGGAISGVFGKVLKTDPITENGNKIAKGVPTWGNRIANAIRNIAEPIKQAFTSLGEILGSIVGAIMEPIKALLKGVGEALAGFFTALANPQIAVGAAMFAIAAASIAAAIFLIGSAIGAVMPALTDLFNNIIMPIAQFIAETVLNLINVLTQSLILLTNQALIPLGEFLTNSFVLIINTVTDTIIRLTQSAVIPLINTLSGTFINVMRTVGNVLTSVVKVALESVASVVRATGDGFREMGIGIRNALEGVQGVLSTFVDLIKSVASAAVAIVALVKDRSIEYGNGYARVSGYSLGGRVIGQGSNTSDSIPAMLSDGEYVIKASTAQQVGYDALDKLNETGALGSKMVNYFTINGYNKSPEELAEIISRKIAFSQKGVIG